MKAPNCLLSYVEHGHLKTIFFKITNAGYDKGGDLILNIIITGVGDKNKDDVLPIDSSTEIPNKLREANIFVDCFLSCGLEVVGCL